MNFGTTSNAIHSTKIVNQHVDFDYNSQSEDQQELMDQIGHTLINADEILNNIIQKMAKFSVLNLQNKTPMLTGNFSLEEHQELLQQFTQENVNFSEIINEFKMLADNGKELSTKFSAATNKDFIEKIENEKQSNQSEAFQQSLLELKIIIQKLIKTSSNNPKIYDTFTDGNNNKISAYSQPPKISTYSGGDGDSGGLGGLGNLINEAKKSLEGMNEIVESYLSVAEYIKDAIKVWTSRLKECQAFLTYIRDQGKDEEVTISDYQNYKKSHGGDGKELEWIYDESKRGLFPNTDKVDINSKGIPVHKGTNIPIWVTDIDQADNFPEDLNDKFEKIFTTLNKFPIDESYSKNTKFSAEKMDVVISQIEGHIQADQNESSMLLKEMESKPLNQYQSIVDMMKQVVSKCIDTMQGIAQRF